ncbi:Disease resistance protein [Arachis hypogaea]|nr:Disease resistance protein [Arachis hypogaea]
MCNPIPDFILECIFDSLKEIVVVGWKKYASNPVDYVLNNKKKLKELEKAINDLQEDRNRVCGKAEEDEVRFGREVYHVKAWLRQVQDIIDEYRKLEEDRKKHFVASFLNPIQRYGWSKTAQEIKGTVGELQNEKCDIIISSWQDLSSIGVATSEFDYIPLKSRETTKKKIKESLEDPNARLIGVFGATGVGKTTLVKSATALLEKPNEFDVVITVKVTKCPDIKRIQGQIADMLGVKFEGESEHARAITIQDKLKNEKDNILIILDDLCAKIDLNSLGIPSPTDDLGPLLLTKGESSADKQTDGADKEKQTSTQDNRERAHTETNKQKAQTSKLKTEEGSRGYKILLISDLRQVLTEMDVKLDLIIHVKLLTRKDGETLFKEMAGIGANNSEIETLAAEIANKCQGLPMSIITTAKALKNQSHLVWKDTHRALEKLEEENQLAAPEYSTKLSYSLLENEELKLTFLLCARMEHDALVADLVRYCIGLGFLQGVYSVWEARDRVQMLLVKLKESGLLSNSYSSDRFTMQNLVRNAALSISSEERRVFMMAEEKLDEWPDEDLLKEYTVISLQRCNFIERFPVNMCCPRLRVFHIENNDPSLQIPDNFFKKMRELRVLILVGFNLSSLPSSIRYLKKLRMLCFEKCILGERKQLGVLGELINLRILSFSGSDVKALPDELKHLSKLQIFDISNCYKLREFPHDVMKSLTRLEELYVRNTRIQWKAINDSVLSVLGDLNQLTNLDLQIPSVEHLPKNLFFDKLYSYKIIIGSLNRYLEADFKIPDKYDLSRCLALCQKDGFDIHSQEAIKMLFERVEILLLQNLNGVQDVFYELNLNGFPYLKRLSIASNKSVRSLISQQRQRSDQVVFPKLESLYLYKLRKMEQIFSCQPLLEGSFGNLKMIKIKLCGCLKNVFLMSMVELLIALETIEISECNSLETIVGETINHNETEPTLKFLKLRSLSLQSLSKFTGLYPISSEEDSRSLFDGKIEFPELERIELSMLQIKHIWSDQILACHTVDQRTFPFHQKLTRYFGKKRHTIKQTYSSFQNLMHLDVNGCWNLESLWSFSVARHLVNLQSLFVTDCKMTHIFPHDQGDSEAKTKKQDAIFPNLKTVKLSSMKRLCKIWNSDEALENSFGKLNTLIIDNCDELVNVIPRNMARRLSSLSCLRVTNCASIKVIFEEADDDDKRQDAMHNIKLQDIHLEALPKLEHVFKWKKEVKWSDLKLQKISVHDCERLENIFSVSVVKNVKISLESLESLVVSDCSQLREIVGNKREDDAVINKSCAVKFNLSKLRKILCKGEDAAINTNSSIQFEFPKLTTVKFFGLSKFKSFYSSGSYELSCPTLKDLSIKSCDLLELFEETSSHAELKNVLFPENSKTGEREGEGKVKEVIHNKLKSMHIESRHLVGSSRDSLEELQLSRLENTDIIYCFLHCNPNLKSLHLDDCDFEELKPGGTRRPAIGVVPKLKSLNLTNMSYLKKICFEQDAVLQKIESLVINKCSSLHTIAPSSVSLAHLTILEVVECDELKYVMSPSTAKSLNQLKTMKVINCEYLEEIVSEKTQEGQEEKENVGTKVPIIFKQLTTLELVSLVSLNSFCSSKNYAFIFPSLENFIVSACPKMKVFSAKEVDCGPNLQKIYYVHDKEKKRWCWHEDNIGSTIRYIFDNKKFFEGMNELWVSEYDKDLKPIWRNKEGPRKDWFSGLKTLTLFYWDASNAHAIPSNVLCCLKSLQELEVWRCESIESIFEMDDTKSWESSFKLKKLSLKHLPSLKSVWQHDKGEILLGFQNLQQVTINGCSKLTSVFPTVLARDLKKLEELDVRDCSELQELVEDVEGSETFKFPRLTTLRLSKLPQLNDLNSGRLSLECPELKQLHLYPKQQQKYPEGGISKVEKLWLGPSHTLAKQFLNQGGFHHSLNELHLAYFPDYNDDGENSTSPFEILADKMLPKLEIIEIASNNCKTINIPKEAGERILHLKELKLSSLHELNSISGLEYLLKLRLLEVSSCPKLTTVLVLHSYSNLKELHIIDCGGLECLLASSAAKMLIHLEELKVKRCESLKEIVGKEEESGTEDIIEFKRLHRITLVSMNSLECFYSGNATLNLPSLIRVDIVGCPKMKFFSQTETHVKLPLFQVFYSSYEAERLFLPDLNVAVACQFLQQRSLDLGYHPELKDLWLDKVHIPAEAFSSGFNLESLMVKGCDEFFTTAILPSHLLPFLRRLQELVVRGCNSAEAIFEVKDTPTNIVIPLKKLTLEKLPNLRHIWNKDSEGKLSLPKLEEVIVDECANIKSVCPESVDKGNIQRLKVKQVVTPHLERLLIDKEGVMMLEKGLLHLDLQNITYLTLQGFNDIHDSDAASVFDFFPKVPLPNLLMLVVVDSAFKEIFPSKMPEILHSQLLVRALELRNLHKLESIGLQHTWVASSNLASLKVEGCASLKYLFTSSAAKCLVQLQQLQVSNCEALESLMVDYQPHDDDHDVIIFKKLKKLSLSQIPKLESFYKGKSTLNFPSLKEVEVTECNRLEYLFTFSTAKCLQSLHEMKISKCESLETLVLATQEVDKSHEDLITFSDLENLSFSQLPKLESFYKGNSTLNFPSLKEVEVTECNRLEYMFTFSTAKSLHKLWYMKISKCESLKTVVLAEADEPHELTFSKLWKLSLSESPKLGSFFTGKSTLKFQAYLYIEISQCKIMKTFSHGDVEAPKLQMVKIDGASCWIDNVNAAVSQQFEKRSKQH